MSPTSLLLPHMARLLSRIAQAQRRPFHEMTVPQARQAYLAAAEVLDLPRAPVHQVHALSVPDGDGGRNLARLYMPDDQAGMPVLLYLHGGGFTIGGLDTHDSLCRQLALRGQLAVLSLDYRLAPEHPFPAATEDVWAALQWLRDGGGEPYGLDASRVLVGGDSAGGTLAAVAAIQARDAGWPLLGQLLITPGTIAYADTASHRQFAQGFLLDAASIAWFFDKYIPLESRTDWRFAPLLAPHHDALAPACLVLAECDPLVDEGLAYGDALRQAGVSVNLELVRGVTHDFIKMGRALPEAPRTLHQVGQWLAETAWQ